MLGDPPPQSPEPVQNAGSTRADARPPALTSKATGAIIPEEREAPPLAFNTVKLASARALSLVISFVAWTLIARELGPTSYGVVQFFLAIFLYVTFASDLGMTTFGTRRFSLDPNPKFIGNLLGARVLIATSVVTLSLFAAIALPLTSTERWVVVLLASSVFAFALNLSWVLRGQERAAALGIIDVSGSMALLVGAVFLVNSPADVLPAAGVAAAMQWTMAAVSIAALRPTADMIPRLATENLRHIKSALPLGVAVLAVAVYYNVDHILLGVLRTSEELGLYAASYRLVYPLLGIAGVLGTFVLPRLSRLSNRDGPTLARVVELISTAFLLFALPVAVGTTLVADKLVELILGADYARSADALRLLIWSTVTVFANAPFGFLILARHQDATYMWITIAGAATNILVNLALIPVIGFVGAAIATLLAEGLVLALILAATRDVSARALSVAVPIAVIPTAAMAVAVWPLREQLLAIPVGIAVYGLVVLAIRPAPIRRLTEQIRSRR